MELIKLVLCFALAIGIQALDATTSPSECLLELETYVWSDYRARVCLGLLGQLPVCQQLFAADKLSLRRCQLPECESLSLSSSLDRNCHGFLLTM